MINERIGANLTSLRKNNKLTQLELAKEIGYSDKSVSKWETGEIVPNVETLNQLANFFGVSLDDIVNKDLSAVTKPTRNKVSRVVISMLAILTVWMLATIFFVYSQLFESGASSWILFVDAVPLSCFVGFVFNSLWGKKRFNYIIVSALCWTALAALYLTYIEYNMFIIFFLGVPTQIAIILWSQLKRVPKQKTEMNKTEAEPKVKLEEKEEPKNE